MNRESHFVYRAIGILMLVSGFALVMLFLMGPRRREPDARWDGQRWSCPDGYEVVADEREAAAGKDSAHCAR